MKNFFLFNFFAFSKYRNYQLITGENGFRLDFSQANYSQRDNHPMIESSTKKNRLTSFLLLVLLFLFTNFLFAQQPACNLSGPLKASYGKKGEIIRINSEVLNAVKETKYIWSFKTNTSNASFATENGENSIKINAGNTGGSFTVQLQVINPNPQDIRRNLSCTCTQSVSVNQ
ncbi:hypothetical protein ACSVH2_06040 [Flavobacterium sp. RSB2_4_14]|uniref:hypothetical protein n=1 Tax=Flavobacterium sp. RSB2_4_14 TaxID=3447665 RepID=UPI003F2CD551